VELPSKRIVELKTEAAEWRTKQFLENLKTAEEGSDIAEFARLFGADPEKLTERFLGDPWTGVAAIIAYLDEQALKKEPTEAGNEHPRPAEAGS
jgi:hypothetical protein